MKNFPAASARKLSEVTLQIKVTCENHPTIGALISAAVLQAQRAITVHGEFSEVEKMALIQLGYGMHTYQIKDEFYSVNIIYW